jgi:alpha-L-rhamnosidase
MNSGNHVMLLGDLLIWCYEDLAGIKCAPDVTGFKKLIMAPAFPDGLDAVSASYQSVYGDIKSAWTKKDGAFNWNITLPANTSAVVRLPNALHVVANRKNGLKEVTKSGEYTDFEIGSGSYTIKGEYISEEMK